MAFEPSGPSTLRPNSDKPKKRESSHTNASKRRGEAYEDVDELP
jgi:hypothetical protein